MSSGKGSRKLLVSRDDVNSGGSAHLHHRIEYPLLPVDF